jgi:hypothetical protein
MDQLYAFSSFSARQSKTTFDNFHSIFVQNDPKCNRFGLGRLLFIIVLLIFVLIRSTFLSYNAKRQKHTDTYTNPGENITWRSDQH